jgi:hypothetical protein
MLFWGKYCVIPLQYICKAFYLERLLLRSVNFVLKCFCIVYEMCTWFYSARGELTLHTFNLSQFNPVHIFTLLVVLLYYLRLFFSSGLLSWDFPTHSLFSHLCYMSRLSDWSRFNHPNKLEMKKALIFNVLKSFIVLSLRMFDFQFDFNLSRRILIYIDFWRMTPNYYEVSYEVTFFLRVRLVLLSIIRILFVAICFHLSRKEQTTSETTMSSLYALLTDGNT